MPVHAYSIYTASEMLGRDRRTLTRLVRHTEAHSTVAGKAKYLLSTFVDLIEAEAKGRGAGLDLTDERAKLTQEQTARERRKNKEAEGRLVDIEGMVQLQSIENGVMRERLLSLPGELQGELGVEGAEAVAAKVREILLELSDTDGIARRAAYANAGLADLHNQALE
jgi:hypothetical protein